ncbi:hypothetical protein JTE90_013480 [Oedothorax gibbosus]|uniref:Uncharacterized protein n=1 Tax=Oedothorax gibbosus TaxID=931172 RepID=A0AAV6VMA6_9ARAC|nr:hypothetical protein JTE90_013480 [Oedothorax gibbosus]
MMSITVINSVQIQPNVCSHSVVQMVKVRKPCLRAYTKIERVRKPDCPYSDEWCVDYKPRYAPHYPRPTSRTRPERLSQT